MRRIGGALLLTAVAAAAGATAYRFLLSDAAKESLRDCAAGVRDAADKVGKAIDRDQLVVDDGLPNRERTISDWELLGY